MLIMVGLVLAAEWGLAPGLFLAAPQHLLITTVSLCSEPMALQIPVNRGIRASELGGICHVCFRFFPHHQVLL